MQDFKVNLATAVREARIDRGLSQEKLAEALRLSNHTIIDIESGNSNPKFENLYQIVTYLKMSADKIFYPGNGNECLNLQKLTTELSGCSEEEAKELLPAIRYLLNLMQNVFYCHKQDIVSILFHSIPISPIQF